MNEINLQVNNSGIKKEPCFKCVVQNLPGGKMGRLCHPCSDCKAEYKREEKRQHERYLAETSVGEGKAYKFKNSKCETCQMPFSQMLEKKIPQRIYNSKLYCQEHYVKHLVSQTRTKNNGKR
jgi:hypothetical protein